MKNVKGSLILFVAAFFWGTTFVAQVMGVNHLGPFAYIASRCFIGSLFIFLFALVKDRKKSKSKWPWKQGTICGLVLFFSMSMQQMGIDKYPENVAAAGRSGFLTATYVIFVAVVSCIFLKQFRILLVLSVVLSIVGMYLLCLKDGVSGVYFGDVLGILCAIGFATHILVIDRVKQVDGVKLSCVQFLVVGILSTVFSMFFETTAAGDLFASAGPILYAGIFSSGVAFTLQIVGQKYAEPTVASIVMSLESVIAALAGAFVLSEHLSLKETIGCGLVFLAVIIAQIKKEE